MTGACRLVRHALIRARSNGKRFLAKSYLFRFMDLLSMIEAGGKMKRVKFELYAEQGGGSRRQRQRKAENHRGEVCPSP